MERDRLGIRGLGKEINGKYESNTRRWRDGGRHHNNPNSRGWSNGSNGPTGHRCGRQCQLMAKPFQSSIPDHRGCKVSGYYRQPDGPPPADAQITFRPEKGGLYAGTMYSGDAIRVKPQSDGRFEVVLPPSSALGLYTVTFGKITVKIEVPEKSKADFASLIREK